MKKYLKLGLHQGKLFINNRRAKSDRSVEMALSGGKRKKYSEFNPVTPRKDIPRFVEPLTFYQIRNIIHVLFGERPIPTRRYVPYDSIPYYDEMAKNSYLVITTPTFINKKGEEVYPKEMMSTKKMMWNSHREGLSIDWNIVERGLAPKKNITLNEFISFLDSEGINVNQPFENVIKEVRSLNDEDNKRVCGWLMGKNAEGKKRGCSEFSDAFNKTKPESEKKNIYKTPNNSLVINNGTEEVVKIDGVLFVPVNDEDIEKLGRVSGTATFLDGGLVTIDGIFDPEEIEWEEFDKDRINVGEELTDPEEVYD